MRSPISSASMAPLWSQFLWLSMTMRLERNALRLERSVLIDITSHIVFNAQMDNGRAMTRRRLGMIAVTLGTTFSATALAACSGGMGGPAAPSKSAVSGSILFWPSTINDITRPFWQVVQTGFKEAWPNVDLKLDD